MASCAAPAALEAEAVEVMEFAFGDDAPLSLVSVRQARGIAPSRRTSHALP
jgi:hypothetical protein